MMRAVHLHGRLKKQFGASHRFDITTAGEALRALNCAFPGDFIDALKEGSYQLVRGNRHSGMKLDLDLVTSMRLGMADLHIIPAVEGASNTKGVAKTILGTVLIGAAIFMAPAGAGLIGNMSATAFPLLGAQITYGNIALIGIGLTLSGAATLLAKPISDTSSETEESFTLSGPSNSAKQGDAIPLIYGETIVGSVTVSFDSDIEDIGSYAGQTASLGDSVQAVRTGFSSAYYGGQQ